MPLQPTPLLRSFSIDFTSLPQADIGGGGGGSGGVTIVGIFSFLPTATAVRQPSLLIPRSIKGEGLQLDMDLSYMIDQVIKGSRPVTVSPFADKGGGGRGRSRRLGRSGGALHSVLRLCLRGIMTTRGRGKRFRRGDTDYLLKLDKVGIIDITVTHEGKVRAGSQVRTGGKDISTSIHTIV